MKKITKVVIVSSIALTIGFCAFEMYDACASSEASQSEMKKQSEIKVPSEMREEKKRLYHQILAVTGNKEKADRLSALIVDVADKENVSPVLIASIMEAESMYKVDSVSSSGAIGLMGVHPSMIEDNSLELEKPLDNITAGARIIKRYKKMFSFLPNNELKQNCMIVGYYAGVRYASNYQKGVKMPEEIITYVNRVNEIYDRMMGKMTGM